MHVVKIPNGKSLGWEYLVLLVCLCLCLSTLISGLPVVFLFLTMVFIASVLCHFFLTFTMFANTNLSIRLINILPFSQITKWLIKTRPNTFPQVSPTWSLHCLWLLLSLTQFSTPSAQTGLEPVLHLMLCMLPKGSWCLGCCWQTPQRGLGGWHGR